MIIGKTLIVSLKQNTNDKTKDNLRNLNKFINGDIKKTPSMKLKSKGDDLVLLSQNLNS